MKKIITFFVVIALVLIEGYLITTSALDSIKEKREIQSFCEAKCTYSENSYFWEFSGESATRGFTTKSECLSYCERKTQGFAYYLGEYGSAFLGGFLDVSP